MALSLDEALGMSLADESDESIHVDVNTRQITIPESQRLFGVESDADVEVKHIVIDGRYADGNRDLSKLAWRVIYRNANKDTSYYLIPSVVANENSIEMDWLIKRSVVAYKGTVDFILCAFATTSSGEVTPEWNSTLGQGIVLEGLETSAIDINKEAVDELAKILYETTKTANSINESMTQISANKEAIGQLKDGKISKFYASSQGNTNLPDSDDGRIMDLKLYGKSEQKQYSGKNLLPRFETTTSASVTFTVDDNGVVTANGTATGYAQASYALSQATIAKLNELAESTFYLSGAKNAKHGRIYLNIAYKDDALAPDIIYNYAGSGVTSFKLKGTISTVYTQVSGESGVAFSNDIFYPMLSTSSDTTYEPYVGGIPSPSPEYPQEIKSVVNPAIKVTGKNLLKTINWETQTVSGVTIEKTSDTVFKISGTATGDAEFNSSWGQNIKVPAQSYLLCKILNGSCPVGSKVRFFTSSYDAISSEIGGISPLQTSAISCGLVRFYIKEGSNINCTVWLSLQMDTSTDYEPYHEQTATLPYTLNAIPVTSGGNVTIDGQQYVADYVDVERGKLVKNVLTLNASDVAWELDRGWSGEGYYTYSTKSGFINQLYYNSRVASAISNAFIAKSRNDHANSLRNVIMLAGSEVYIEFIGTDKSTLQEWTNYIETNPVMIFAALKNPTETDLTADEIAAFKSLVSYYPVTNVSTTSDQLDGYTVFNYPISLANGWNYVKQQLGDTRDYLYGIDLMTAEAYVNSEYAAALAEIEV